jgi:hypothetical protein
MQWSKEKQTEKGRQYNGLKKTKQTFFCLFFFRPLYCRPLSDCFSLEHFIVDLCLFVFLETMVLSTFVCLQWSKEKQTDKGRQYNGLKKNKQTKVDNTMV